MFETSFKKLAWYTILLIQANSVFLHILKKIVDKLLPFIRRVYQNMVKGPHSKFRFNAHLSAPRGYREMIIL